MFRRFTLLISMSCLVLGSGVFAQDNAELLGWEVIERCVGELQYPIIPQNQWNFEGVIFSENTEGIRAIRTDIGTSYFVLLKTDDSFLEVGTFSPDGRWFAYPAGNVRYDSDSFNTWYSVNSLIFIDTSPQRNVIQMEWLLRPRSGQDVLSAIRNIEWLDNEHIVYPREGDRLGGVVNPFTEEYNEWENEISMHYLSLYSPDFSRAFYYNYWEAGILQLYDIENNQFIYDFDEGVYPALWLSNSSKVLTYEWIEQNGRRSGYVGMRDRNGELIEIIGTADDPLSSSYILTRDETQLAYWSNARLHMADLENRVVYDFCLDITASSSYFGTAKIAWSPDGTTIAVTYNGYPILLNVDTLDMQILSYETGEVLGWYPLD